MRKREFEHGVIYNGDCLDVMPDVIEDHSIDMILADLPYGITACHWDRILPINVLWEEYHRILSDSGAVALTATQPFASDLITSNKGEFRQELIWDKMQGNDYVNAKRRHLKAHENILLFGNMDTYNPQCHEKPFKNRRFKPPSLETSYKNSILNKESKVMGDDYDYTKSYPTSVLSYSMQMKECNSASRIHPTQKPVELFQYLIMTYTNKDDIVLDNVIGSGTTAIAAYNTGRRWIGIEKDPEIFDMACERIEKETRQQNFFN